MTIRRISALLLAVLCGLSFSALALYEDQVGEYDWVEKYVGRIVYAAFRPNAREENQLAVVASAEQGIVAAIRDRYIVWKMALAEGDALDQAVLSEDGASVLVVSNRGHNVQLLRTGDGSVAWSQVAAHQFAQGACPPQAAFFKGPSDVRPRIFVLNSACDLAELKVADGAVKWTAKAKMTDDADFSALSIALEDSGPVVTVATAAASQLFVARFNVDDGTRIDEPRTVALPGAVSGLSAFFEGHGLVLTAEDHGLFTASAPAFALKPAAGLPSMLTVRNLEEVGVSGGPRYALSLGEDGSRFLLEGAKGTDAARLALQLSNTTITSRVTPDHEGVPVLAAVDSPAEGDRTYKIYRLSHGAAPAVSSQWSLSAWNLTRGYDLQPRDPSGANPPRSAAPRSLHVLPLQLKDGTPFMGLMQVGQDAQTLLLATRPGSDSGSLVFFRDEFLAEARDAVFVDLPAKAPSAAHQKTASIAQLIRLQAIRIKALVGLMLPIEEYEAKYLSELASGKVRPTRDLYGLRRAIAVASPTAGRVSALHSGNGRVLWSTRVFDQNAEGSCRILYHGLYANSHSAEEADRLYTLSSCNAKTSIFSILDAFTGEVLETSVLPFRPTRWVKVPEPVRVEAHDQHIFLAVHASRTSADVIPSHLYGSVPVGFHFWEVTDAEARTVEGFAVAGSLETKRAVIFQPAWKTTLDAHGKVVTQAVRDPADRVYSALRPLPGRQTALKYVNPNTAALVVGPEAGKQGDATVYILDTVTGRVLHSQAQRGAAGPFTAIFGEHWVTVHFFMPQLGRHALLSVDLYETAAPSVSPADLLASTSVPVRTPAGLGVASSRAPLSPGGLLDVHSRLYYAPHGARAMTSTWTAKGIAQRLILLGTSTGQVYMVDRRHVDARRPIPTERDLAGPAGKKKRPAGEADEHLLYPYSEHLGLEGTAYLSHKYRIEGIREMRVEPTGLESTSLLLTLGSDHFFTRVQPSKQFDSLSEDFAYGGVLVTMAAMAVGAYVLRAMAKKDDFEKAWR